MRALTLHIGQPKAASTSLQQWLHAHADRLAHAGITFPITAGELHNSAIADLVLTRPPAELARRPQARQQIERVAVHGAWNDLVQQVRHSDRAIVTSETLIAFGPDLIDHVLHELTGGHPERATVVIVSRPASHLLPSEYSELARSLPTTHFETWLRMTLTNLARSSSPTVHAHLDLALIRRRWAAAATCAEVPFDPPTGADFEALLMAALEVTTIETPTALPHINERYSAAWIEAWQRHLRSTPCTDPAFLRAVAKRAGKVVPHGGTYELRPEVATVVDAAFPRAGDPGDASSEARQRLRDLALSRWPLTTVGVADDAFEAAIERCLRELRRGVA